EMIVLLVLAQVRQALVANPGNAMILDQGGVAGPHTIAGDQVRRRDRRSPEDEQPNSQASQQHRHAGYEMPVIARPQPGLQAQTQEEPAQVGFRRRVRVTHPAAPRPPAAQPRPPAFEPISQGPPQEPSQSASQPADT